MDETLTIEKFYAAYDAVYRFPEEEYLYVCHPDDLARLRESFTPERWGTCPLIQATKYAEPGKVFQIRWNWQR